MGSIDGATTTTATIQLPVIDISNSNVETGKHMLDAAVKFGFLFIDTSGTGFTKEIVDREFALSQQFFALPDEEKQNCLIRADNRGWTGMHNEILDPKNQRRGDFKQAFNIGEFDPSGKPQQPMPSVFQHRQTDLFEFENLCRETCNKILDVLALGLQIKEPHFFSSRHTKPSGCTLRLLHYPAIPDDVDYDPKLDIRAGAHSDYGSITLLFQRLGQPGLEIRTPEDTWAPVPVMPDGYNGTFPPILVNIADLLSYWTNGLLKSTVHRVIVPDGGQTGGDDRYSIVFFCHPANDTELIPVPSELVQARQGIEDGEEVGYGGGAATKRALTAQEHLQNRLAATYGFRMETGK